MGVVGKQHRLIHLILPLVTACIVAWCLAGCSGDYCGLRIKEAGTRLTLVF